MTLEQMVDCGAVWVLFGQNGHAHVQGKDGYPSMTLLYLHAMDRLWQICPDCLFLIEGATHFCDEPYAHLQAATKRLALSCR